MGTLQQFNYDGKTAVRGKEINGEAWLVAKDVCEALGYKDFHNVIKRLDDDEFQKVGDLSTPSGNQTMLCVNQSGLYHLIFKSRMANAKKFRRWVTQEVLPAVMSTGHYEVDKTPTTILSDVRPVIYITSSTRQKLQKAIMCITNKQERVEVWQKTQEFTDSLYADVSREVNGER